jgi:hypothetical protein
LTLAPIRTAAERRTALVRAGAWKRIAGAVIRAAWATTKLSIRIAGRSVGRAGRAGRVPGGRDRAPSAPALATAAVTGAGIAFLLDPVEGKRRRHILRDRTGRIIRRTARRGAHQASYVGGKVEGAIYEAHSTPGPPADDQALADRVRTEIFRRPDAPKGAVNIGVVDGVVDLRGELPDQAEIERLVADARRIPGVRDVKNLLHTPGTPAPSGAAA